MKLVIEHRSVGPAQRPELFGLTADTKGKGSGKAKL